MLVVVDVREKKERVKIATKGFLLENCEVETRQLPYGDYLIEDLVVWEYKTVADFINSLYDESLFNEVFNQSNHYPFSYLIIEGDFKGFLHKQYYRSGKSHTGEYNSVKEYVNTQLKIINGAIRRCRTVCNVINLPSQAECLNEILEQSRKCVGFKAYGGVVRPSNDYNINPCKSILMEVKGVGDKLSDKIIEEYGLRCVDDLSRITYDGLSSIKRVNKDMVNDFWIRMYGCTYDEWFR